MNLSMRIKEIITEKHYKQSSIAHAAGFNSKIFNNMVNGRRKIYADDIPKICNALCVTPSDLFDKVGDGE